MKRVFIVGSPKFPRGSAGANYDQYVALALKEAGWNVIILGKGTNRECDAKGNHCEYKGIIYENEQDNLKVKYGLGLRFYKKMYNKYHMNGSDYFIVRDLGWLPQFWLANKCGLERMCYVHFEDLRPEQYKLHVINPQYWCFRLKWGFKQKYMKKAFPISEILEKQDQKYGCKTLRLPIMADPDEFGESKRDHKPEVLNFIYPGAKLNGCEDNIQLMLESFAALSQEEKKKVRLNITGTSYAKLEEKLGKSVHLLADLKDVLVIHKWLEYEELIDLYRQMDFLILVRFFNPVTLANFPSKVPETLSFGIIPVCTRVGEYTSNYLVDGQNSIVFEPDSREACLVAIRKAIHMSENEYLRYRSEARENAVEKFGYKQWSKRLNDFILS